MMYELSTVETPKKVRSVRFNDSALETIVSYTTDEVQENRYNSYHPQDDDVMRSYRRSGSHESLYNKISIETASTNPRVLKKRSSDLDDSNHFSSHSSRNTQFDFGNFGMTSPRSRSRCADDDLDVSRHDRQQRHFNKRVMCV